MHSVCVRVDVVLCRALILNLVSPARLLVRFHSAVASGHYVHMKGRDAFISVVRSARCVRELVMR